MSSAVTRRVPISLPTRLQPGSPTSRRLREGVLAAIVLATLILPFPTAALLRDGVSAAPAGVPALFTAGQGGQAVNAPAWMLEQGTAGGGALGTAQQPRLLLGAPGPIDDAERQAALATLEQVLAAPRPVRDPIALRARIAGHPIDWKATDPPPASRSVGDRASFYVLDQRNNAYQPRDAELRLVSEHAYWYVEVGQTVKDDDLAASARQFDERTYPTIHRVFGQERSPGIDGDPRITMFLGTAPGVAAYFTSWDPYPRSVFPYSNEREMIHVNLPSVRPGTTGFDGTIAHEFQHLVHWSVNPSSESWLDEGFAELASVLAVPGRSVSTAQLPRRPDVQLTAWAGSGESGIHYQASYGFSRYLEDRFGEGAIHDILAGPGRPPDTISAALSRAGSSLSFDDVFEDWIAANLINDPAVGDGRYGLSDATRQAPFTTPISVGGAPVEASVHQYGAEYFELKGDGRPAAVVFQGAPTVQLVGAAPTSGRAFWWSDRADNMDTAMTRSFDLHGLSSATLRFNAWYDTERDYDYLYVMASSDGGATWRVLEGTNTSTSNRVGNAVGPGYSGQSGADPGSGGAVAWVPESVDLTPFAGGEVLVRFEYVTDQGTNLRGALIDDVEVPELDFRDDAESDRGWSYDGFIRSGNAIPQTWSLQLVEYHRDGSVTVRPLRADGDGRAVERFADLGGATERAVLVVSGLAPRTLEEAPFRIELRPAS
ncbi:MAG: immune inhibitor A [Chloroflexi bacterium]|nr:immune inhibitor A [Chloroflexota bacterium]